MAESKATGCDCGTMFFQVAEKAEDQSIKTQIVRNAFVEMASNDDTENILKQNGWNYVKDGERFYVVGDDALKVAKMFPGKIELRRPLQDGVLNKGEEKKLLVLDKIISSTVGNAPDDKSVLTTCVSSASVDGSQDSDFHKRRLEALFKNKGWNVKIIEEAHAVILSERPTITEADGTLSPYSGIGISCGAGRCNCVLSYKGMQILGMSVSRSGDYIDKQAARDTVGEENIALVTSYKETKLDFDNLDLNSDIAMALDAYYDVMLKHVFTLFAKKFQEEVKSEFDQPLPIVVAGGTSMPKGFINKLTTVINSLTLPFKVKEIKHAKDPRNAVVEGCLAHAIASQKKLEKDKIGEMLEK
jgi:hypothetical protein